MRPAALIALLLLCAAGHSAAARPAIPVMAQRDPTFAFFQDPDPFVSTKEFALYYNRVPDTTQGPDGTRGLFHLMYQRSAGPQAGETTFGHAWSTDLRSWLVDTLAFSIDDTPWNAAHVWSPSILRHGGKDYMFYTGVDALGDQRLGYASTSLLDTTDTVWDPARVMVWEAGNTQWAVPDPWMYSGQTQFRDPYVMDDPEHPGQLLMFFAALDSIDFRKGRGSLAVGVARSEPGTLDAWQDLGFFPSTLVSTTHVGQLEGPHVFPAHGSNDGWRLMFSSAGSPPGEVGETTIRFETLAPGASVADTTPGNWGARPSTDAVPERRSRPCSGGAAARGCALRAWTTSAASPRGGRTIRASLSSGMIWAGDEFTLETPGVTAVDEFRSPTRRVRMTLANVAPGARHVTFRFDSPVALAARLDVFDAMGRRLRSLLDGTLPKGSSAVTWDLTSAGGGRIHSGVYFARLSFTGGLRTVRIPVVH